MAPNVDPAPDDWPASCLSAVAVTLLLADVEEYVPLTVAE